MKGNQVAKPPQQVPRQDIELRISAQVPVDHQAQRGQESQPYGLARELRAEVLRFPQTQEFPGHGQYAVLVEGLG